MYDQIEKISKKELTELQGQRLKHILHQVYDNNGYFKKKLDKINLKPSDITKLDDLSKLPFSNKDDLRLNYPLGLMIVDADKIIRFHVSSGTTGNPTVVGYTEGDIENWTNLMARCLSAMGVKKGDIVQNAYGYGLFTGGLGIHYGAERLGTSVIPVSTGNTKRQIKLMQDMKSTVLSCTPSYALVIAETLIQENIDPAKDLFLRVGVFGAEPWSESTRKRIRSQLNIEPFD
ncbi:MAG: phenylacetate--CoA ligase, partial [Asgard group archaeon]|nr:phenylacetate--CoA ligase [Asgard group archaeon]